LRSMPRAAAGCSRGSEVHVCRVGSEPAQPARSRAAPRRQRGSRSE
jgi:hypothetical protein